MSQMSFTWNTRDLVLCSLFSALIAVGAFIKIPIPVVSFTLQFLFTTLAGLLWQNFYIKDAVSAIPQIMGQDLVTFIICVPILLLSLYFISKESLKGQLFWLGVIFYFLYTYASNAFLVSPLYEIIFSKIAFMLLR